MMNQKELLKTAERNFIKFHAWAESAYPAKIPCRVYVTQVGDTLQVEHVWQYGSVRDVEIVANIPMYPKTDPGFSPELFYGCNTATTLQHPNTKQTAS